MKVAQVAKAVAAFLSAGVLWVDGIVKSPAAHVTSTEWSQLVGIGVTAALVFLVPNAPADSKPAPPAEGI